MQLPESISEFIGFFSSESFKSEPSKKKLISKFFGQKEFNQVLVEAVSFLASEIEKERNSKDQLLQAVNSTLRAQNAQIVSVGSDLIEERSANEKLTREMAFQQNLFSNQNEKLQDLFNNFEEQVDRQFKKVETSLGKEAKKTEQLNKEGVKLTNLLSREVSKFGKQSDVSRKELKASLRDGEKKAKQLKSEISLLKNLAESTQENQVEVSDQFEEINNSLKKVGTRINSGDKKAKEHEKELSALNSNLEDFDAGARTLKKDLTKLANRLGNSETKIEGLDSLSDLPKKLKLTEDKSIQQAKELENLSESIAQLEKHLTDTLNRIEKAETSITEASTQLTIVSENKLSTIESNYSLNETRLDTLHKTLESSVLGFIALENAFKSETENTHRSLTDIGGKIDEAGASRKQLAGLLNKKEKLLQSSINEVTSLFQALRSFIRGNLVGKEKAFEKSQKGFLSKIEQLSEMVYEAFDTQPLLTEGEYVAFENKYRGSPELIKKRLAVYKPDIVKALGSYKDEEVFIADLGCGRGEWLSNLSEWGFKKTMGIDTNAAMVEACKEQGIAAKKIDLFDFLKKAPKDKYHMISAFHVLEHLTHKQLNELAAGLMNTLKPGGYFLFETPNPGNVIVGASTFHLDPTHKVPLNMELSEFFFQQRGFAISKTYFLNGLEMDFDLGENPKRSSLQAFLKRWIAVGLDYGLLIQKPLQ